MEQISFRPELNNISAGIEFVRETLIKWKIPKKRIAETILSTEDAIAEIIRKSDGKSDVSVRATRIPSCSVRIQCSGETIEITDITDSAGFDSIEEELSEEERDVIGKLFSYVYGNNIRITNKKGINICNVRVKEMSNKELIFALAALVFGAGFGILMKFVFNAQVSDFISQNILSTVTYLFMNSLKLCLAPLVFLSVLSSVSGFRNIRSLGKISLITLAVFLVLSILSIAAGFGIYNIFPIGNVELSSLISHSSQIGKAESVSFVEIIKGVVPSSVISPFVENNVLQVIFISLIFGIGMILVNDDDDFLPNLISKLNDIVNMVIKFIVSFIPLVVFCSIADTMRNVDFNELIKVFSWIPVTYLGFVAVLLIYSLVIFVFLRENPITFFKKFSSVLVTAFSTSSSSTAIPMSIRCCVEKLGISQKVASFVIPLGNATNKNGSCITHAITVLFLAKVFGIPINTAVAISILITIIIIKTGAPGVAGGFLVALSAMLPLIGIPPEAIGIIMGIFAIVDMGLTLVNVAGDAVAALLISKCVKEFDRNKYILKD